MKRISILFIAAGIFIAATFSRSSAVPADKLDTILSNMQTVGSKLGTLYAEMEQRSIQVDIGDDTTSKGVVFFKHGKEDKALIKYSRPQGQALWIIGDKIYLYQAKIKQVLITSRKAQASKNPEASFVASPYKSVPQLKSQYNIVYLGEDQGYAKLELTPKSKSSVKTVTLWVDQSMWLPVKYQIIETNNNVATITLANIITNGVIADSRFKPDYPSDTKVINQ